MLDLTPIEQFFMKSLYCSENSSFKSLPASLSKGGVIIPL